MLFVAKREQMTEPTPGDLQMLTQDLARALGRPLLSSLAPDGHLQPQ